MCKCSERKRLSWAVLRNSVPCGVNRAVVPITGRWLLGLRVPRGWLLSLEGRAVWREVTCARQRVETWQSNPGCQYQRCLRGSSHSGRVLALPSPPFAMCGPGSGTQTDWCWVMALRPPAAGLLDSEEMALLRSPSVLARRCWSRTGRPYPRIWLWKPLAQMIFPGGNQQLVGVPDPHRLVLYLFKKTKQNNKPEGKNPYWDCVVVPPPLVLRRSCEPLPRDMSC